MELAIQWIKPWEGNRRCPYGRSHLYLSIPVSSIIYPSTCSFLGFTVVRTTRMIIGTVCRTYRIGYSAVKWPDTDIRWPTCWVVWIVYPISFPAVICIQPFHRRICPTQTNTVTWVYPTVFWIRVQIVFMGFIRIHHPRYL